MDAHSFTRFAVACISGSKSLRRVGGSLSPRRGREPPTLWAAKSPGCWKLVSPTTGACLPDEEQQPPENFRKKRRSGGTSVGEGAWLDEDQCAKLIVCKLTTKSGISSSVQLREVKVWL
jgi:hypothetical protein